MLKKKGADTEIGSRLREIFLKAGFCNIVHEPYKDERMDPFSLQMEIEQMKSDLDDTEVFVKIDHKTAYSVKTYYAYAEK